MPTFHWLTPCVFDHGAVAKLAATLARLGVSRPFLVSDAGLLAAGVVDRVAAAASPLSPVIWAQTQPNPTEAEVIAGAEAYRAAGCDGIVAVGGGSSLDMGKAIGLFATHAPPHARYGAAQRGTRLIGPIPPLVAIPTTAGTGSEVSSGAMVTLADGRKEIFIAHHLLPATALCDPELTLGLPPGLTAATGMDALTHCIEAFLSPMVNPVADGIALDGIERVVRGGWLARAVADGTDREARWHMMMASYQGALAFVKGLGATHALSHAAGRLTDLRPHHGTLNAILLPHVLKLNAPHCGPQMERLGRAMGVSAGAVPDTIAALSAALGVPARLGALGLTHAHGEGVVSHALADLAHATNPVPLDQAAYEALYAAAL
jgi:alcohol dehydrogenase class IV